MFLFGKKKKREAEVVNVPPMQEIYDRLAKDAFHMVDGKLYSKDGDLLIACDITQDDNGQFWMYPDTAVYYQAPWLEAQEISKELLEKYEARSLQWMASLGKFVYFK